MPRSESAGPVRVDVSSRYPVVEFELLDSAHRTVASAPRRLCVDIAPGVYELRTTAGRFERTEVLTMRPGSPHVVGDVPLDVPTATPRADHPHAVATGNLSAGIADRIDDGAGLVLVLRGAAGKAPAPADVEVLDEHSARLTEPADWQGDAVAGWTGWTRVGPPGGYVVRYRTGRSSGSWLEVPLWLQAGWQTVVFVPCEGGPDPAAATVHLTPRGVTWTGHTGRDVLCQLLLCCLETGQAVPPFVLEEHVPDWRRDPMLALLAGAAMAATGGQEYARLLAEVERLLPGHPDVAALRLGRSPRPSWTPRLH
ncbi:hypothetical protein, partial [Amycolatopsis sp. H20-H5]|uniref:hypothetical protein n=1 Tax=Amycolatopsis sp. H20-H5 TaxID=3046309 RepID=UPI002DBE02DD